MKKILFFLLVFSFVITHAQTPQIFYGGHYIFDLNNSWGLGQKEYVARDYIFLQNGFHANSLTGQYFRGRIDDKVIVPTDYSSTTPYDENSAADLDFNLPVGSIPGSAAVGPDGSANYTIPIAVPPGINGIQPQLSIVYNSNMPNGLLGLGWNLNGISVITRMSKTVFKDGDLAGINLDGNDLFSLDGQRLVLESTGTYGADDVYYRTESESNIRVLSHGTQGNGPSWFEVFYPDGSVAEYGLSYNDQNATTIPLGNNNSTVLTWHINKYMDRHGNYMLFYYRNKGPQTFVDYILYTGNGATGTEPMNRVDFYYEERSDKNFAYAGGGRVDQTLLLSRIVVRPDLRKETEYKFSYFYDDDILSSKLNEVKFVSKNSEINSTKIVWNENSSTYFQDDLISIPNFNNQKSHLYCSGDFDGDGISELLTMQCTYNSFTNLYTAENWVLTNVGSYSTSQSFSSTIPYSADLQAVDVNGDFKDELICMDLVNINTNTWHYKIRIYEYNPQTANFAQIKEYVIEIFTDDNVQPISVFQNAEIPFLDLDGDGTRDFILIYYQAGNTVGEGFHYFAFCSKSNQQYSSSSTIGYDQIRILDFNGNGKHDLMLINDLDCNVLEFQYDYDSGFSNFTSLYNAQFPTKYHKFYLGDFNGDRKTDIITYESGNYLLYFSTGINFSYPAITLSGLLSPDYFKNTVDLNANGKDEMIFTLHNYNSNNDYIYSFELKNNSMSLRQAQTDGCPAGDFVFGDFDGDGSNDVFYYFYGSQRIIYCEKNDQSNLINSVFDGNGSKESFSFQALTKSNSYSNDISSAFYNSQICTPVELSMNAVINSKRVDYFGNIQSNISYKYHTLLFNRVNRNIAGFLQFEMIDNIHNVKKVVSSEANLGYFKNCRPFEILNYSLTNGNEVLMSKTNIEYNPVSSQTYNPIYGTGTSGSYCGRENSFPVKTISIDYINNRKTIEEYDKYADINSVSQTRTEEFTTTVYESADANSQPILTKTQINTLSTSYYCHWFEVQLNETNTQTIQTEDDDTYSRTTQFQYNSDGSLHQTVRDPGTPFELINTIIEYDDFGHPVWVKTEAFNDPSSLPVVTNKVEYERSGRFVQKTINTLDQIESSAVSNSWGQPISSTDINGHETQYEYDDFNQLKETSYPDGTAENYSINLIENNPDMLFVKTIHTIANNGATIYPDKKEYLDAAGRTVRTETVNLNNQTVYTDITYNAKGQTETQSLPYTVPFIPQVTTMEYDNIGRLKKQILPDNSYSESIYSPGQVVSKVYKNGTTQQKTEHYDGAGRLTAVDDNNNTSTQYLYYASGKPREVWVDGMQQHITMQYDLNGNRTLLSDPDAGTITNVYNAYGQLVSQTNANGQVTEWLYDDLGRPLQKNENAGESTIVWEYDNQPNGLGMLSKVTNTSNNTSDEYFYDGLSRLSVQKQTVEDKEYVLQTYYNFDGRVDRITYPGSYTVKYKYLNGFISELVDYSNGNSIWKALLQDDMGNITQSQFGNTLLYEKSFDDLGRLESLTTTVQSTHTTIQDWSYTYDDMGNIESRIDYISNQNEHFTYDNLNRLSTVWKDDPSAQQSVVTLSMNYDPLGNMTEKSDIGAMTYDLTGRPHALQQIVPTGTYLPSEHHIDYFSSGRTREISDELNGAEIRKIEFIYGPDDQRRKTVYTENGNTVTKYFAFGNFEETVNETTGDVTTILYISSPDGIVAMRKTVNGTSQMYYVLIDHLGSIDAVVPAVPGAMPVVEYYSFDAWGNRRNPSDWSLSDTRTSFITDRGYTGHEMLDAFRLINANGRIYEPATGRFLSPDDFVQSPDFSQSFNRYAYCWNNPLNLTDPSGEFAWFVPVIIGAIVGAEIGGTWADNWVHWAPWNWSDQKKSWTAAGIGALAGAGAGLAVSWGLTGLGVNVKMIYTGASGVSATTLGWDIGMNAILTSNINMLSSWAQGRDINEVALSGASGFIAGAIGGGIGYAYGEGSSLPTRRLELIKNTNYYTGAINGALDRFSNSAYNKESTKQIIANTIIGAGEGLYMGWLGNRSAFTSHGWHGIKYFTGRYISAGITQIGTSVPGLGVTLAAIHSGYFFSTLFTKQIVGQIGATYNFLAPSLLIWSYINSMMYTTSIFYPCPKLWY